MVTLTPGLEISIYEDPVTRKKIEGRAILKKFVSVKYKDSVMIETWKVRFVNIKGDEISEEPIVLRKIRI